MITDADWDDALKYEERLARLLAVRSPTATKAWWQTSALLSAATAVLTVAVTSIGSYFSQASLREAEVARQRSHDTIETEVDALTTSTSMAADAIHYTDERAHLARGDYRALKPDQIHRLIDSVNASDTRWREGRGLARVLLGLRFGGFPVIVAAWDSLAKSVDRYSQCSLTRSVPNCQPMRGGVDTALIRYREAVLEHLAMHMPSRQRHFATDP